MKTVYIIGSLRNPKIPFIARRLRSRFKNLEVFDAWFSPGPATDSYWRKYSKIKGLTYKQALASWEARHIFEFDKKHIDRADFGLLVMKAGRSAHLEAGYMRGRGKSVFALFEREPERFDVMLNFVTDIFFSETELHEALRKYLRPT